MARTDDRGGRQTKERIAACASRLFAERGFEDVTVTEIGRAAGVSSVTVFKYFPKKEDLFFDRADEISEMFLAAVHGLSRSSDVLAALKTLTIELLDRRHPLSGVDERSIGFFRTVSRSPVLTAKARQIAADIQQRLARELDESGFEGDAALTSAFFIAGYAQILSETATGLIAGLAREPLQERHRARVERLFRLLGNGIR